MKIRFFSLLCALCLLSFGGLQAQTTRTERAKDRAEDRANRKVDNKIDRTVDGAVDDAFSAIGGLFKKKDKKKKKKTKGGAEDDAAQGTDEEMDGADMSMLSGLLGGEWEPYTNPKEFSLKWDMKTTKRNGKSENMQIQFAVLETQSGYAMYNFDEPDETTRMILDTQTGKTTLIATEDGETTGTKMRMPNMQAMMQKEMEKQMEDQEEGRWDINRTGERKTIDGYNCEKYVITDTETGDVTTSWITSEAGLSWTDMSNGAMGAFTGGQMQNPMGNFGNDILNGIMIQSTTVTKKETIELYITDIKTDGATDKSILDVSGIEITELRY